jgi:hypothetical protein
VVLVISGVVKLGPEPIGEPPVGFAYQFIVAPNAVAADNTGVMVSDPASHLALFPGAFITGTTVIIVARTGVLAAVEIHPLAVSACA